jgi:hypothetical protein
MLKKNFKILTVYIFTGLILGYSFPFKSYLTANRESAGIALDPAVTSETVLYVYSAHA